MTHAYAVLGVSASTYAEIRDQLEAAGYQHAFQWTREGDVIDMHGIALADAGGDTAVSSPNVTIKCEQCGESAEFLFVPSDPSEAVQFACGGCCGHSDSCKGHDAESPCEAAASVSYPLASVSAYVTRILEDLHALDETTASRINDLEESLVEAATPGPLPLILHCPKCHLQHVDVDDETGAWATTRHHRKHLCKPSNGGCGYVWAPANVHTVGVSELPEVGDE